MSAETNTTATPEGLAIDLQVCPVVAVSDRRLIVVDLIPSWPSTKPCATSLSDMWTATKLQGQEHVQALMRQLIAHACTQWLDWFAQGVAPRMSLPVIIEAVSSAEAIDDILSTLQNSGVPPSKLQLRLTESSLAADQQGCIATAKSLRAKGLAVALEQCGDSHPVVSALNPMPFDSIRIKSDFVTSVSSNPASRLIVATLTKLSAEHGVTVIGCGVNSAEQWDFLQESDCDGMRGDMITAPMPARELMDWLYMSRWQRIHRSPASQADADNNTDHPAALAPSQASTGASGSARHALIVDDDPIVTKVLSRQLSMLGFAESVTANDGEQAMAALHSNERFDVIFCDLKMPGTDGIAFLRSAATLIPDVAVVLISSVDAKILRSAAALARAHQLDLLGTLSKPINTEDLSAVVDRLSRHASNSVPHNNVQIRVEDVRDALKNGHIEPYFQPQVDAKTGQLLGAEALARWRKNDSWIAPDVFIAIAEAHGLIDELTEVILARTVLALGLWDAAGLKLKASVNVTLHTLERPDFSQRMHRLCKDANLAPARLQIEVTESRAMHDPVNTREVATRLRLHGFDLSIDDFGTGYSTLSQLREMPFSELKVDQSFVGLAHLDHEARSIVESSLKLAHTLNLKTVAEGIETSEDWRLLKALGCDVLQGYFISHARSASDFLVWANEYAELLRSKVLPP